MNKDLVSVYYVEESLMKDAYSFHATQESLDEVYDKHTKHTLTSLLVVA